MKKVTTTLAAKIRDRRARGETIAAIAAKYHLSVGTISGVVNAPGPAPIATAPREGVSNEPSGGPTASPPSHDDLRSWLADQVAALRADCARYRAANNATALAAANRNLNAATALLERMTPAPASKEDGTFVTSQQMTDQAEKGEKNLEGVIRGLVSWRATWPVCATCHTHIRPTNLDAQLDDYDASRATRLFAQLF